MQQLQTMKAKVTKSLNWNGFIKQEMAALQKRIQCSLNACLTAIFMNLYLDK